MLPATKNEALALIVELETGKHEFLEQRILALEAADRNEKSLRLRQSIIEMLGADWNIEIAETTN